MRNQLRAVAASMAMLALGACSDTSGGRSITGVPSLNANSGDGTTHCEGTLPPGVYDNIVVLPGMTCVLNNSVVLRNILALPRSEVTLVNDEVRGDIEAHNVTAIVVSGGSVGRRIHIKGGEFPGVSVSIHSTVVEGGNIEIEKMEAGIIQVIFAQVPNGSILTSRNTVEVVFQVAANTVGNSVEVFDTTGPASKFVNSNTAGVAVRCEGNSPPFVGGPNAAPEREGQCF